jgi:hypothetical protein
MEWTDPFAGGGAVVAVHDDDTMEMAVVEFCNGVVFRDDMKAATGVRA